MQIWQPKWNFCGPDNFCKTLASQAVFAQPHPQHIHIYIYFANDTKLYTSLTLDTTVISIIKNIKYREIDFFKH